MNKLRMSHTGLIVRCNEEDLYIKIKYLLDNKIEQDRLRKNLSSSNFDTKEEVQKLFNYIN